MLKILKSVLRYCKVLVLRVQEKYQQNYKKWIPQLIPKRYTTITLLHPNWTLSLFTPFGSVFAAFVHNLNFVWVYCAHPSPRSNWLAKVGPKAPLAAWGQEKAPNDPN